MIITFNIDDSIAQQFRDGFCTATGWQASSGISQDDWIKQRGIAWYRAIVKQGLTMQQMKTVSPAVDSAAIS